MSLDRDHFVYLKLWSYWRNRNDWKKEMKKAGIFFIRTEEGTEELMSVLRCSHPPAKKTTFPREAIFIPGSKLWVKPNSSSVEIGQAIRTEEYVDGQADPVTRPAPGASFNTRQDVLISKEGVFIIQPWGDPDRALDKAKQGLFQESPLTEIRLEFPLWIYPKTLRQKVAEKEEAEGEAGAVRH